MHNTTGADEEAMDLGQKVDIEDGTTIPLQTSKSTFLYFMGEVLTESFKKHILRPAEIPTLEGEVPHGPTRKAHDGNSCPFV